MLQVETTQSNSPIDLQEDQSAILSFPSGIDLQELVRTPGEDVGIFFVVYDDDTWFPVRIDDDVISKQESDLNPVGSAVVGFTIAGLPDGTILPEPVSINLRITDPNTGSSQVY